jgi:hypothetical protein
MEHFDELLKHDLNQLQKLINNSGQNTKKNHKRVVVLYVIKNHVNLHKL